ncbi:putative uncharacterized protein [Parachlamydia acanthamoebae UV-7]|jgi:hypothetical protein|uniref:Uncharacterized protein n=4 Tax=Parachlamydiaceae TaxID=92713 RepID=F8L2B3_PARAV|nr:hypothetical protein pah_c161o032 [Parachlamydia acanthamoebae str. Hall's coccus]CCB87426.1 putative uncharacterized protein [Parachlamydia acanthamoebae UV-7]
MHGQIHCFQNKLKGHRMLIRIIISAVFFYSLWGYGFADRYIIPTTYDSQDEVLIQGALATISNKKNSLLMYQTCEKIVCNKANFYFSFSNLTDHPIHLYFSNLKVTDQLGRPIKVMHKKELIDNKKSEKNWKIFASAIYAGIQTANAENAGRIDYVSKTKKHSKTHFDVCDSRKRIHGTVKESNKSVTKGTIHCEALRQQALRRVDEDSEKRDSLIQDNYKAWEYGLNHFYFDSTTVFPDTIYASNFQIEVPKQIEKELEYLIFTFETEGENHSFCFYCGDAVKKCYHFES